MAVYTNVYGRAAHVAADFTILIYSHIFPSFPPELQPITRGRHRRLAGAAVMYQDKDPNSELEPRAWAKHSANAPRRANPLKF